MGCSGYWIDFAAKHPSEPGRYVLAIEADGVMYHSSDTARDRDRLRQDHLERLGWRFHRIWSSEWFRHRDMEVARVLAAYDEALRGLASERVSRPEPDMSAAVAPERPASEHDVAGTFSAGVGDGVRGPIPFRPDGRPITGYYMRDLVKFIQWLESDGRLRTQDELIALAIPALGYERTSAPRREALVQAIAAARLST